MLENEQTYVEFSDAVNSQFRDLPNLFSLDDAIALLQRVGECQIILRFVNPQTARRIIKHYRTLAEIATAILVDCDRSKTDIGISEHLRAEGFLQHDVIGNSGKSAVVFSKRREKPGGASAAACSSPAPMRTLVILDNSLTGERGHNLSVARNITNAALRMKIDVVWAANDRLSEDTPPEGVLLERCFKHANYDAQDANDGQSDLSQEIFEGWRRLIEKYDAPDTHYLIHSATGHHFRAAQRLFSATRLHGVVHLCTFYDTSSMPGRLGDREIDRQIFLLTRNDAFGQQLFLWAETQLLAHIYSERFDAAISALPLPAPDWAEAKVDGSRDQQLVIAFLGAARREKGFLELPPIVRAILDSDRLQQQVRFVLQAAPPVKDFTPEITAAVQALQNLPGVEIIPHTLDDAAYRKALLASDVILLPYRPRNYAARGSGILIEALACGKICLVSHDTALSSYDADAPILACRDVRDWRESVRVILGNWGEYRQRARHYADAFCRRQNGEAYIRKLISPSFLD